MLCARIDGRHVLGSIDGRPLRMWFFGMSHIVFPGCCESTKSFSLKTMSWKSGKSFATWLQGVQSADVCLPCYPISSGMGENVLLVFWAHKGYAPTRCPECVSCQINHLRKTPGVEPFDIAMENWTQNDIVFEAKRWVCLIRHPQRWWEKRRHHGMRSSQLTGHGSKSHELSMDKVICTERSWRTFYLTPEVSVQLVDR